MRVHMCAPAPRSELVTTIHQFAYTASVESLYTIIMQAYDGHYLEGRYRNDLAQEAES